MKRFISLIISMFFIVTPASQVQAGFENLYPLKSSVDDNDYTRGISEEGSSVRVINSVLKTYLGEGTATPYIDVVGTGDDRGLICTEQWSVGTPGDNKESVFGGGDSYGVGLEDTTPEGTPVAGSAWHCDIANTTNMVITSATDITTPLSSDSGSTVGLFGGTATGKYILVGSEYKYGGVKAKIDTLGVIEAGNIQAEYLSAVNTWIAAPFMVTDADPPYTQKGNVLSSCGSCSEQWRFGFNPLTLPVAWEKVTLTINGSTYTKFWSRFRILSDITTDAIIQQLKLHTNRFEINADGATEYFGIARYPRTINFEIHEDSSATAANQNISIATGITEVRTNNKFSNNSDSAVILSGVVPEGSDTSIPIVIIIDWYSTTDAVGDVELTFKTIKVTPGFVYDGTATPNINTPVIKSLDTETGVLQRSYFLIDASTTIPGDKLYGRLGRDARVANTNDTFAGDIVITGKQVIVYNWRP